MSRRRYPYGTRESYIPTQRWNRSLHRVELFLAFHHHNRTAMAVRRLRLQIVRRIRRARR